MQVLERVDHAEHGAEQADERDVVAERAEDDQVAIGGAAPARALAVHRLGDRLGAALALGEAAQRDLDRDRRIVLVLRLEPLELVALERAAQLAGELLGVGVAARGTTAQRSIITPTERTDSADQQPQHPVGAELGEVDKRLGQSIAAKCYAACVGARSRAVRRTIRVADPRHAGPAFITSRMTAVA